MPRVDAADPLFAGFDGMAALCHRVDWSATPAGPVDTWPDALRAAVRTCLQTQGIPMAVWIGAEGTLVYNDAYVRVLGTTRHPAVLGRRAREVWPELWDRLGAALERLVEHGEPVRSEDQRFSVDRGDGPEDAWFTGSFAPIRDRDGRILGALSVFHETTERVRSTTQQQDFLSFALSTLRAGAWDLDVESRTVRRFVQQDEIFGNDPSSVDRSYEHYLERVLPEERERVDRIFRDAVGAGTDFSLECRIRRTDGEVRWIWAAGTSFSDPADGRPRMSGIVQDITERKRAEELLRVSEARLKFAQEAAGAGIWHWNLVTGELEWSDQLHRLFGRDPATAGPITLEGWRSTLHPGDRARAEANLLRAATDGTLLVSEDRIVLPSGEVRWVNARGRTTFDAHGRPLHISGICIDVTERKRAEESLRVSEERFATAFYGNTAAMTLTSLEDGRLLEVNDQFVEMSGFTREYVVGRTTAELGIWQDPGERTGFLTALRRDGAVRGEYAFVRPDGRQWTAIVSAQMLQLGGRPTGISSIVDITARKQAEEALRASEQIARQRLMELEALYETAPIGLCVFDEQLRWTRLNRVIAEINGVPVEAHLGRTPSEVVPDVGAQAEEALRAILQTGERLDFEMRGTTAAQPGVERIWSEHWVPLKGPDGHILGISVAAEEITDRKRAAEALAASEAALREADRRKNEFLGWLSHELRNPLNVIRGNLALIDRAGLDSPHAGRALSGLNRQVGVIARLLDDLLDITRIAKGKIRLHREAVELNELVRTIGDDHRGEFERRGIHFDVRLPNTRLLATADRTRMIQVVGNLLHNACKFTPRGGHVSLALIADTGPWALIEVADDGAGIRPELLESLFDPLIQDDRTIARSEGGLGLGLSLVKGLVELHGGSVSAASDGPDLGAVFTIRLPLTVPEG